MEEYQREFHLEEYRQLKNSYFLYVRNIYTFLISGLVASSLIAAFVISQIQVAPANNEFLTIAAWLPLVVSVCIVALFFQQRKSMRDVVEYISILEARLAVQELGWEKYCKANREYWLYRSTYTILFILLIQLLSSLYLGIRVTQILR